MMEGIFRAFAVGVPCVAGIVALIGLADWLADGNDKVAPFIFVGMIWSISVVGWLVTRQLRLGRDRRA